MSLAEVIPLRAHKEPQLYTPMVYVAGPYTNPDPVENIHRAVKIADTMLSEGVVIPFVPHLTGAWHMICPRPYEDWLAYDLLVMARCDAVFRFSGSSSGADREVQKANEWGIPVFYDKDDLYKWVWAK